MIDTFTKDESKRFINLNIGKTITDEQRDNIIELFDSDNISPKLLSLLISNINIEIEASPNIEIILNKIKNNPLNKELISIQEYLFDGLTENQKMFLIYCSYLNADSIEFNILNKLIDCNGNELRKDLQKRSFIQINIENNQGYIKIHRLIQDIARKIELVKKNHIFQIN